MYLFVQCVTVKPYKKNESLNSIKSSILLNVEYFKWRKTLFDSWDFVIAWFDCIFNLSFEFYYKIWNRQCCIPATFEIIFFFFDTIKKIFELKTKRTTMYRNFNEQWKILKNLPQFQIFLSCFVLKRISYNTNNSWLKLK